MKKLLYILTTALCLWTARPTAAQAQNSLFEKYSDMDNVEYICITKSMLRLMSDMGKDNRQVKINGVTINGFTDAIKVLLIINTDNDRAGRMMKTDFKTLKSDPNYEMLMMVRDDYEKVTTLYNSKGEDRELVMFIDEQDEQTFIVLSGKLTKEMINKILSK